MQTLNENTYIRLKRDIMTLRLVPGEAVSAAKVAERYQVSRTPAREAIVKLAQEGLMEIYPQSRTLVSRIDLRRAAQECFVRATLEVGMVPLFTEGCSSADIDVMRTLYARQAEVQEQLRLQPEEEQLLIRNIELDNAFHAVIYTAAGEILAKEIIETHTTHYNRLRFLTDMVRGTREQTLTEHRQILAAAETRDTALLQAILKKHIRRIDSNQTIVMDRYPEYFQQ